MAAVADRSDRFATGKAPKARKKARNKITMEHNYCSGHVCSGPDCSSSDCPLQSNIKLGKSESRDGSTDGGRGQGEEKLNKYSPREERQQQQLLAT